MAEHSILWPAPSHGDGLAAYSTSDLTNWVRAMIGSGVHANYLNALHVFGTTSPLTIESGAASVDGIPYWSDANVSLAVPTPSAGTTGHIVVLRADWTAQTVRVALRSSPDGTVAYPALVASEGSIYEVLLAQVTITTGGVITVVDARSPLYYHTSVSSSMMAVDSVITSAIQDGAVTTAKIADRTRTLWVPVTGGQIVSSGSPITMDVTGGIPLDPTVNTAAMGSFMCPADYVDDMVVAAVLYPAASGNIYLNTIASFGGLGEDFTLNVVGGGAVEACTGSILKKTLDISAPDVAAGDFVICGIERHPGDVADVNASDVICLGFKVSYTADS